MNDSSRRRKVFVLVRVVLASLGVVSVVVLGVAAAVADHREGHPSLAHIPGKYGTLIWAAIDIVWHPMVGIPALAALLIGCTVYVWAERRSR